MRANRVDPDEQEQLIRARRAEEAARDKAVAAWAQAAGEHEGAKAIIEVQCEL
jgi:hypothetical protein